MRTNIQKSFNEFNPACVYGYALVSLSPITYIKNPTQICASRRGKNYFTMDKVGKGTIFFSAEKFKFCHLMETSSERIHLHLWGVNIGLNPLFT